MTAGVKGGQKATKKRMKTTGKPTLLPPRPEPVVATCPAWCDRSHPPLITDATEHHLVVADHVFTPDHARIGPSTFRFQLGQREDHWDGNGSALGPQSLWFQPDRGEGYDLTAAECRALAASFRASAVLLELAEAIDGPASA